MDHQEGKQSVRRLWRNQQGFVSLEVALVVGALVTMLAVLIYATGEDLVFLWEQLLSEDVGS